MKPQVRGSELFVMCAQGTLSDDEYRQLIDFLGRRFEDFDGRFEVIDRRFDAIDRRFDAVDAKLAEHDHRFDAVEARLTEHDERSGKSSGISPIFTAAWSG